MCWSGEASTAVAAIGIAATAYALVRKEPRAIWMTFGFFTLMEILQAFTYLFIDDCASPANQVATLLGYLHIAFQPFFVNAFSLQFVPKPVRDKIAPWAYGLCFAATIVMLIQLYPFAWAGVCTGGLPLCGTQLCAASGNWHMAWHVPYNGMGGSLAAIPFFGTIGLPTYSLAAFWLSVGACLLSRFVLCHAHIARIRRAADAAEAWTRGDDPQKIMSAFNTT